MLASSLKELGIMVIIPTDDTNYTLTPLLAQCNISITKLQKSSEKQELTPNQTLQGKETTLNMTHEKKNNILDKTLAIQIQQYIKRIIHH